MGVKWKNFEPVGYLLALTAGLVLRLINLNSLPLTLFEARWALPAFQAANGLNVTPASNSAYTTLTAFFYFIFSDANLYARLVGVLVGSSLIVLPYFYRQQIGSVPALVLAFGLAVDPFFVYSSRLAGGPMLALGFIVWGLTAWIYRKSAAAGVFAGLAFLSGTAFWQGAASLLLGGLIWRLLPGSKRFLEESEIADREFSLRQFGVLLIGTLLLVGTGLTLLPLGLGALGASLPEYAAGWVNLSGQPALRLLLALAVYQPLAVIFATTRVIRRLRYGLDAMDLFLLLWAAAALVLVMLMPGRQPTDLIWVVFPVLALASRELGELFATRVEVPLTAALEAGLIFLILMVGWLNLAALLHDGNPLRWYFLLGLLLIAVITTYLIGTAWDFRAARVGLAWGLTLGLGLLVLGEALAVGRPRLGTTVELWEVQPAAGPVEMLTRTLGDLSEWHTGRRDSLDIVVLDGEDDTQWLLRDFINVMDAGPGSQESLPSVWIADANLPEPELPIAYRGQSFVVQETPGWTGVLPPDWLNWLFFRVAPVQTQQLTLWARSDRFPGGELITTNGGAEESTSGNLPEMNPEDNLPDDSQMR
jgi:hypothetical protein